MKRFFTLAFLSLSMTACETSPTSYWSSLNPFGGEPVTEVSMVEDNKVTTITPDQTALETELSEMEFLTGSRPRLSSQTETDDGFTDLVESTTNNDIDALIAELENQPATIKEEKIAQANLPEVPTIKPNPPAKEQAQIRQPLTNTIIEAPKEKPVEAPAIVKVQPAPVQQPEIKAPKPVPAKMAQAPIKTINEPLFTESDLKLSSAAGCPKVEIMPAARSITYFEDGALAGQMKARAVINEIKGGCDVVSGGVELDLDILMRGHITNKGRFEGQKDKEAFMTFPYFVSVTTPQGLPVDKQILATAMRFRPSVDHLDHAEKITQFIPMTDVEQAANYKIIVGYQLNRKQLEYNRAQIMMRTNNMRVSPDTSPARRVSRNPLDN